MSKALQTLNLIAIGLLGTVLGCVLVAQTWPRDAKPGCAPEPDSRLQQAEWPKTLQVYPFHRGDPVELLRILKDGEEVVPGTYRLPAIAGDGSQTVDAVNDWLKDVSFVLRNQAPKAIISVGISVVFPARRTDLECTQITGHKSAREPWCDAHPHYCDGGCPALTDKTLHWGQIPAQAASALEARYRRHNLGMAAPEGEQPLRLAPGQEIPLSAAGGNGDTAERDPRHPFTDIVNGILFRYGIDEAKDTTPCLARLDSKTGCALSEVSKFNIALDIVYFEDGTIWGNFGYGLAAPNPDGVYTRVQADGSRRDSEPAPTPN
jgi:hypothetical protein